MVLFFVFLIGSATYRICLSVSVCFIFMVYGVSWLANDISVDRVLGSNNNNYSWDHIRSDLKYISISWGDSNLAAWLQLRPLAMLLLPWPPLHQRTPVLLLLLLPIDVAAAAAAFAAAAAAAVAAVVAAAFAAASAAAGGSNCYWRCCRCCCCCTPYPVRCCSSASGRRTAVGRPAAAAYPARTAGCRAGPARGRCSRAVCSVCLTGRYIVLKIGGSRYFMLYAHKEHKTHTQQTTLNNRTVGNLKNRAREMRVCLVKS